MNQCAYSYRIDTTKKILLITDEYDPRNPTKSVTNGVEEVLKEISQKEDVQFSPQWHISYVDTEGDQDMIYPVIGRGEITSVSFGPWVSTEYRFNFNLTDKKIKQILEGTSIKSAGALLPQYKIIIVKKDGKICQVPWDWKAWRIKVEVEKGTITKVISIA